MIALGRNGLMIIPNVNATLSNFFPYTPLTLVPGCHSLKKFKLQVLTFLKI